MDDFLRTLSREKLLLVLERELSSRLKACAEDLASHRSVVHVRYSGLSLEEAKALIEKMPHDGNWEFRADTVVREFPLIIIDSKVLRMIASVKSAFKSLLKDKRAELAAALLGEGVLND
jgi:DNA-binding transcriptional MerR regulator